MLLSAIFPILKLRLTLRIFILKFNIVERIAHFAHNWKWVFLHVHYFIDIITKGYLAHNEFFFERMISKSIHATAPDQRTSGNEPGPPQGTPWASSRKRLHHR
ncbi:hypothetical protein ACOME3_001964 [Neoechinorhynchus agilis]